ncbi:hypothetical protein [Polaromonas sp.]|uniref:hypothetical protein n=1 Tax=Polaromonas sp. TaxID=1869339 RepID=UPI0038621B6C
MNFKRPLLKTAFAIFLIAAGAISTLATGQNLQNKLLNTGTSASGPVVTTEQVRAELLAWAPEGVEAGKPVWVGLQLAHQPEWHTYWKNSGDSGPSSTLIVEHTIAGPVGYRGSVKRN